MLIIAGSVLFDNPSDRDDHVRAHTDLLARARDAPGCLGVAIDADSLDPCRVNIYERWEDAEALERWRARANAPQLAGTIVGGEVLKFEVSDVKHPFG